MDPERHRPEGMEMAGRVEGVRPDDDCLDRLARAEGELSDIRARLSLLANEVSEEADRKRRLDPNSRSSKAVFGFEQTLKDLGGA